jgi:Uma2 family endonuclease
MSIKTEVTIDDLYRVPGKAELVGGEIIMMSPTGAIPGYAAGEIFVQLREYARRVGRGYAITDNIACTVDLPNRESFCPDVAYHLGPMTPKFLDGPPLLAVEVRSEGGYGAKAEREIAEKRTDYFAAGTQVVWDVDVLKEQVVRVYRATAPTEAAVYRRGELAEAEPAAPGWTMAVDDLFLPSK